MGFKPGCGGCGGGGGSCGPIIINTDGDLTVDLSELVDLLNEIIVNTGTCQCDEVAVDLQPLLDKMCTLTDDQVPVVIAALESICDKIENLELDVTVDLAPILDGLEAICDKLEAGIPVDITLAWPDEPLDINVELEWPDEPLPVEFEFPEKFMVESAPLPYWATRCLIMGEENVSYVKVLNVYNCETECYEVAGYYTELDDGTLGKLVVPADAVVGYCLPTPCEEDTPQPANVNLPYWTDRCLVQDGENIGCVKVLNTYNNDTSCYEVDGMFTELPNGALAKLEVPEGVTVEHCIVTPCGAAPTYEVLCGPEGHYVLVCVDPSTGEITVLDVSTVGTGGEIAPPPPAVTVGPWTFNQTDGENDPALTGPASFPTSSEEEVYNDIETVISIGADPGCGEGALAKVKFDITQSVEGDGHRGSIFGVVGGTLTQQINNDFPGTIGASSTTLGSLGTFDTYDVVRTLEFCVPVADLLGGVRVYTQSLGSETAGYAEWLSAVAVEITEITDAEGAPCLPDVVEPEPGEVVPCEPPADAEVTLTAVCADGAPATMIQAVVDGTVTLIGFTDLDGNPIDPGTITLGDCPVLGGDCANPLHTLGCNDEVRDELLGDILEKLCEIADTPPPVDFEYDVEFVCDGATNTYTAVVTTTEDGVVVSEVSTPTEISCDLPAPDYEIYRSCVDGFVNVVLALVDDTGLTEISSTQLTETCGGGTPECVKWSSVVVQLDNTGTLFSETHTIEFDNSDGSTTQINVGPFASWSDQITGWAAAMDAAYAGTYDPRCTTGCGGLLPPPADAPAQPGIFARYVNGVHCPTDLVIPVGATVVASDNPKRIGRVLPLFTVATPEYRGYRCVGCEDGYGELLFEDGTPVPAADLPVCTFVCSEAIPEPPSAVCATDTFQACDAVPQIVDDEPVYPLTQDDVVANVFVQVITCGGAQTVSTFTLDEDSNLVEYTIVGDLVDCVTLEPVTVAPPVCPEGAVFECVEIQKIAYILDNSNWDGSPTPHLTNGNAYEVTFTLDDGSTVVWQQTLDPYYNNFINTVPDVLGCSVRPVCANHTNATCRPNQVAPLTEYGLTPDISELWASGWFIECGSCDPVILQAEITGSVDPAYVGAVRDLTPYPGPVTKMFRAVTCDGTFYKDCDGNAIAAPDGACCITPCEPASLAEIAECLADVKAECADACAVQHQMTKGRPNNGAAWSWGPFSGASYSEFSAALAAAGISEVIDGEAHWVCGAAVPADTELVVGGVSQGVPVTRPNPDAAPSTAALATVGCLDDEILGKLCELVDDDGPATIPCQECAVLPFSPGQIFTSPVIATVSNGGSPVPLDGAPFGTIEEFAVALEGIGYSVDIDFAAGTFAACGVDLLAGYILEDGTVITAVSSEMRDGVLVCDPNAAANSALLADLLDKQCETNELLAQLVACLCAPCDEPVTECPPPTLTSINGTVGDGTSADGWHFTAGQNDPSIHNTDATFPFGSHPASSWGNVETTVTVDEAAIPEDCLAAEDAVVELKLSFDQSVDGLGHRLHFWTISGGQFVGDVNNGETVTYPATSISVGEGVALLTSTDVPRCVLIEAPLSTLTAAGITLATGALGGQTANGAFDGVDLDEQITNVKVEITDIKVDGESCCG